MAKTLKEQTVSALFWNFMEKGGQQIFQFVFTFVLARLLTPNEYGLIGILAIFIAIANILQESGFSSALIRKKDADEEDYATVFYFNISISVVMYTILFASAPQIANFYDKPLLTTLSRILFLAVIFNALGIIQNVHLVKKMNFKTNAQISLFATLVSGSVAVVMAYQGYGVWSLVAQQVILPLLRSLGLWIFVKWRPRAAFNTDRLKKMSGYSSKLLLNSLFNQITSNIIPIVFAKKFSFTDAGYYQPASKLSTIPQSVVATSLQGVAFPLLNKSGDDLVSKKRIFRKVVRIISFISFPLAILTFVISEPLILVLLKDQWLGAVPILRILTVGSAFIPLFYLLSSLLQSLGKSGLLLSIELARNIISVLVIIFSVNYGVNGVVIGSTCVYIASFLGGYYVAGKCIGYKITQVLKDILPYLTISAISFLPLQLLSDYIDHKLLLLITQSLIGCIIYLVILTVSGSKVMEDFIRIIRRKPLN